MLLLGLSTGHKIGLGLAVLGFAGFSLIVSLLVPRWYPDFPGRGLRVFIVACLLLFVGMMSAVIVLARETSEAEAKGARWKAGQVLPYGALLTRLGAAFACGRITFTRRDIFLRLYCRGFQRGLNLFLF